MYSPKSKPIFFVLEGLNSLATAYFGGYIYFLLEGHFRLPVIGNLSTAALGGFVYMLGSWQGGRFAQRFGYATSLQTGLAGMVCSLGVGAAGMQFASLPLVLAGFLGWMGAMCFTWPALEALMSDGATNHGLQKNIGIYNLVWAGAMASMYCIGGKLYESLGRNSIFWLPAMIHVGQFLIVLRLGRDAFQPASAAPHAVAPHLVEPPSSVCPSRGHAFLRMAWFAIPFSYVGITTVNAVIPSLATALKLTTAQAGLFCSLWMFARLGTFAVLWRWSGWHYRFRWLLGGFVGLVAGFTLLLLSRNLGPLVVAQLVFGVSIGIIYYSSLFYSLDVGETKGEHGGLHEAMIGAGSCMGPAVGALSLCLIPGSPDASAYAVAALLACGLASLIGLRVRQLRTPAVSE